MSATSRNDVTDVVLDPDHHFVTDMDVASLLVTNERSLVRAPLTDAVRSPAGCASVGMLATLLDVGASDPALATCRPDWTATQDLSIHAAGWLTEGPIVIDCRLVRVGTRVVIVSADAYDGHGTDDFDELRAAIDGRAEPTGTGTGSLTLAATGLVTFARLPGTAATGVDDYNPATWLGEVRRRGVANPPVDTMYRQMGLQVVDAAAGEVRLERASYVINSIGTINGGALAVLAEVGAEVASPGFVATDMQIHYLSQVRVGPARTSVRLVRETSDHRVVSMQVHDAGNGDQLLALVTVTLQRTPERAAIGRPAAS